MYDPYTATSAPYSAAPFAGGKVAADVAAELLEEAARYLRIRAELWEAREYITDALNLLGTHEGADDD